jgi:hypothetical protein
LRISFQSTKELFDHLDEFIKLLSLHFMMHHMTRFCKRNMLTFAPDRGNLLSLLRRHHCSALRVARQEQDGTGNALNRFLPGSARWNKRDIVEHVQIELRLSLKKGKERERVLPQASQVRLWADSVCYHHLFAPMWWDYVVVSIGLFLQVI